LLLDSCGSNFDLDEQQGVMPKLNAANLEVAQNSMEILYSKKAEVRKVIIDALRCDIHSLPDKIVPCWKEPVNNQCYVITEQNLNMWATLHVST
jgi:hypothetical protein